MDLILLILILIVTFTTGSLIEKAHFNKVFKGIETQSDAAQKALKERVTAYKKGGLFKRI